MIVEHNVPLQAHNSFGIVAKARELVRVRCEDDLRAVVADPARAGEPVFVLGGGSNIVLTGDVRPLVLKVEIRGRRVVDETARHWIVEAGAGENWHDFVDWTLAQGWPGLENLALIPGSVGAAPIQNIGAYGVNRATFRYWLQQLGIGYGTVALISALLLAAAWFARGDCSAGEARGDSDTRLAGTGALRAASRLMRRA